MASSMVMVLERGWPFLEKTLDFEVEGQRKKGRSKENGRPKKTWKRQVKEESMKIDLSMEDALYRSKWIAGVNLIATGLR